MTKFTDLIVWQKAHKLFLDIVEDVEGEGEYNTPLYHYMLKLVQEMK
jgi:hypothetical protein